MKATPNHFAEFSNLNKAPIKQSLLGKLKIILANWCRNSTSHGLPNIIESDDWPLKIMWILFTLASAGYCVNLVVEILVDFSNRPVVTTVQGRQ